MKRGNIYFLDYNGNNSWDETPTDRMFAYGWAGDTPLSGDWDGDGDDQLGVKRDGIYFLDYNGNNSWDGTPTDRMFAYGWGSDTPLSGDWDGDGADQVGVKRGGTYFLDYNGNDSWDGTSTRSHVRVRLAQRHANYRQLGSIVFADGRIKRRLGCRTAYAGGARPDRRICCRCLVWNGLVPGPQIVLHPVKIQIADLPSASGRVIGNTITLDIDAAGYGWFVDTTPTLSGEITVAGYQELLETADGLVDGSVDLLSVILHEMGHLLGFDDIDLTGNPHHILANTLEPGTHRIPWSEAVDELLALIAGGWN